MGDHAGLDDDDFWSVALGQHEAAARSTSSEESLDVDTGRPRSYTLPCTPPVTLQLAPLQERDGIWSHLGSQAWHASALLAALLLTTDEGWSLCWTPFSSSKKPVFLELGSGAVGLSGLALAAAVGRAASHDRKQRALKGPLEDPLIILSDLGDGDDTDGPVLTNLRRNVQANLAALKQICIGVVPHVKVQPLDWNHYNLFQDAVQVVVGSELIYTPETARACAALLIALFSRNQKMVALLVQVLDREGFRTHFLPELHNAGLIVTLQAPVDEDVYRTACDVVASSSGMGETVLGGTMDRFGYGACWIRKRPQEF